MLHYYKEISFNTFTVNTTHYPKTDKKGTCLSYQDSHDRSYFQTYDESTNPNGYNSKYQRESREWTLLTDAVDAIKSEIDSSINLDIDGDYFVDYVSFHISSGSSGGRGSWGDILWPHKWNFPSYAAPSINGKYVSNYVFMLGGSVGTLCHEFGHSLGAPDMYRYDRDSAISSVSGWDLMGPVMNPPLHMSTYTKYKYTGWIDEIPIISENGIYTLDKSSVKNGRCYRINSPNSTQEHFIVEFRKKEGIYEVMKNGMIIWRVHDGIEGNAEGPPDELYVYREGGTTTEASDPMYKSDFSIESGRTEISDSTDPSCFLNDGSPGGLVISEISSSAGDTMTFRLGTNNNNQLSYKWFRLEQNYPNPFIKETQIDFSFSKHSILSNMEIVISNVSGKQILSKDYKTNTSSDTTHSFILDGSELNQGLYYYNLLENGKKSADSKMFFKN